MKKNLLKSLCLALLLGGAATTATAQGIVVNKTDGTKVYYKASEVLSVGVYGYGEEPEPDPGTDPDPEGHEWVDLGLPSGTLWATCNVGAEKPEDYGDYFAWGETSGYKDGKTNFSWSTYSHCNGSNTTMTKYCTSSSYGTVDNKTELEPMDDAATANWGSGWQMPSLAQCQELINSSYTTTTWTTQNGVNGRKITSKSNGNSIFLPAAGCRLVASLRTAGSAGYYWSRSLSTSSSDGACGLYFDSSSIDAYGNNRLQGRSVRPVRVQN